MPTRVHNKPSEWFAIRLNAKDQERRDLIVRAGLAENTAEAIRCGLKSAASKAKRIIARSRA